MLSDTLLQQLSQALHTARFKREPCAPAVAQGLPPDLLALYRALGGWHLFDLYFSDIGGAEGTERLLTELVDDLEAGRSNNWNHSFWHRSWRFLGGTSFENVAYDPVGCFGGAPGQIIRYDFKGGEHWHVFFSTESWVRALCVGLDEDPGGNPLYRAFEWACSQGEAGAIQLPDGLDAQRSPARFDLGAHPWVVLRHDDGRRLAIHQDRLGFDLHIGEGDEQVRRRQRCKRPGDEVARFVAECQAEGFVIDPS